jgi:hypothetical protein
MHVWWIVVSQVQKLELLMIPSFETEIGPGGSCGEGFVPIIQGDNARPHEDGMCKTFG